MTDQRTALHDQIEQVREEDIDSLFEFVDRFLHPSESAAAQKIVFTAVPSGSIDAAAIEEQRQQALAQRRARQAEMITRFIGDAVARLGIDLNQIAEGSCSWSASSGKSGNFFCSWLEEQVFNRVGLFHLKERRIVTFERCHISETRPEVIYEVRVLTPSADVGKQLTVPI